MSGPTERKLTTGFGLALMVAGGWAVTTSWVAVAVGGATLNALVTELMPLAVTWSV